LILQPGKLVSASDHAYASVAVLDFSVAGLMPGKWMAVSVVHRSVAKSEMELQGRLIAEGLLSCSIGALG